MRLLRGTALTLAEGEAQDIHMMGSLLGSVPFITTIVQFDRSGRQQMRLSRDRRDLISGGDDPKCLLEVPPPTHQEVGGIGIGLIMRGHPPQRDAGGQGRGGSIVRFGRDPTCAAPH